jgi:ribose-phosphate pyrophosphokinase
MDSPLIIAGSSHPALAQRVAECADWQLGTATLKRFACGEVYVRLDDNVRRRDLVIVQSPHGAIDEQIWELLALVDAARGASAGAITALIPCLPYARQDKTGRSRESITSRLLAKMLEAAGVDHVLTMDLHTGQLQGTFRIPCDHITAEPLISARLREDGVSGDAWVIVAPDAGRAKLARRYAAQLGTQLAIMSKERPAHGQAQITRVIGAEHVGGRHALLIDDIIDTAGTLTAAAERLLEEGAASVSAACTHAILSGEAVSRLESGLFATVWGCDTVAGPACSSLRVISTAPLLADALQRLHGGESLSELFDGRNQQF